MSHTFIKPTKRLDTDVKYSSLGYIYAETGKTGQQIGAIPIHTTATRPGLDRIPTGVVIFNSDTNCFQISDKRDDLNPQWLTISGADAIFDNAVLISGNQSVSGHKTFNDGMTINGDLQVNGNATYIQTENLYVEDNIITLNSTFSGSPTFNAGVEVNRGNQPNSVILWNEALDLWQIGISGALDSVLTQSGLNSVSGNLQTDINSRVLRAGDTMTGALTLAGIPTLSGHATNKFYVDQSVNSAVQSGIANATLVVEENNVLVYSGANNLDIGHALDVSSGSGEVQLLVDESELNTVVFLSGTQTISGVKTFANNILFNGNIIPGASGTQTVGLSGTPLAAVYADSFISTGSPGIKITRSGGLGVIDTSENNGLVINRNGSTRIGLNANDVRIYDLLTVEEMVNVEGASTTLLSAVTGTPALNASLNVNRGSSTAARLLWDESVDSWKVGISGAEQVIATEATALLKANNLSDLTNVASGRTNLGLGALAVLNSVNDSNWSGTDLSIANGGTGASDAATARTNLGLGTVAIESIVPIAKGGTGANTAPGARSNLGLGSLATLNTINNDNWSGTDLSIANGGTGASDAPTARSNLGLGSLAVLNTINDGNWSGTDLSVANGGTGASDAATARSNLSAAVRGANNDISSMTALTSISTANLSLVGTSSVTMATASAALEFTNVNFFQPTANFGVNLGDQGKAFNGVTMRDLKNDASDDLRVLITNNRELKLLGGPSGTNFYWIFGNGGIFTAVTNGTQDLGTPGSKFGTVYAAGGVVTFTGKHLYQIGSSDLQIGEAVVLSGNKIYRSSQANDSSCVGILTGFEVTSVADMGVNIPSGALVVDSLGLNVTPGDLLGSVAAVGDSRTPSCSGFNVCNEGGPITPGTLLVTASGYPGCLKAQSDNILRANTIGKAMENVNFSGGPVVSGVYGYLYCG